MGKRTQAEITSAVLAEIDKGKGSAHVDYLIETIGARVSVLAALNILQGAGTILRSGNYVFRVKQHASPTIS